MKTIFGTLLLTAFLAAPATAQDWSWRKSMAAGQTVEIRSVIGRITATPASGTAVEIVAHKSARRSDPASVDIKVVEHERGIVVCVIYEGNNHCDRDNNSHGGNRENDTRVDFEVRLPRGVNFTAQTVIGDVSATGLSGRVTAGSVSGGVRVATTGIANASTVSGSIDVRMGRADWSNSLNFSTVSGNISLEIASDLNTDVEFSTVSGNFESDWPITTRTAGKRRLRGTIGSGGRELTFSTVSGNVEIRRAN
jgi:hypothetical protein